MAQIKEEDFSKNQEKVIPEEIGIKERVNILDRTYKQCYLETLGLMIDISPFTDQDKVEVWLYDVDSDFKLFCGIYDEPEDLNSPIELIQEVLDDNYECFKCKKNFLSKICDMVHEEEDKDNEEDN